MKDKKAINNDVGKRIRELRQTARMTQLELAEKIGLTSKAAISKIEHGERQVSVPTASRIADALGVHLSDILFPVENEAVISSTTIPVLGRVVAGAPLEAVENIVGFVDVPISWTMRGECFGLKVMGESMSPFIMDGDVVIVEKCETAETGDYVIALVNGKDACCKKYMRGEHGISLISLNPAFASYSFTAEEVEALPVVILGRVIECRRSLGGF